MTKTTRKIACLLCAVAMLSLTGCNEGASDGGASSDSSRQTGVAGSTARMIIDGDYLYAISGSTVQLFDITSPETPMPWVQVEVDEDIQTLFAYENYLLVGDSNGIHILDNSDRAAPERVGNIQHALTRDPVVAQNDVAYATLRRDDSQATVEVVNQLNVIDISNVEDPRLEQVVDLQGPSGLAVRGERLYVCDGTAGLKIFDISEKFSPSITQVLNNVECNDVIATDDTLHVIGPRDYSQYNTSLTERPQLMSTIRREPVIYVVDR